MDCKDCIHYEVCENGQWYETPCVRFKNKADFVEVVRCKDCKFALKHKYSPHFYKCDGCNFLRGRLVNGSFWCKIGIPKERED